MWTGLRAEVEEIFARLAVPRISRWGESGFRVYVPQAAPEWTPQRREWQRSRRGTVKISRCVVCREELQQRAAGAGRQRKICGREACAREKQREYQRTQKLKRSTKEDHQ